jgi:hypothetical protein
MSIQRTLARERAKALLSQTLRQLTRLQDEAAILARRIKDAEDLRDKLVDELKGYDDDEAKDLID